MAENKGILPSSTFNTLGNNSNKWEAVYANKIVGPLTGNVTGNVSGSSSSCTGNSATATSANYSTNAGNADTLDGYHYNDIINNVKSSVSSGGMGAPNWDAKISLNSNQNYTAPKNGYFISAASAIYLYVNNMRLSSGSNITVPIGAGDIIKCVINAGNNESCMYVPCL